MGVYVGASTKIIDRETGEILYGKIPKYSVVVPGSVPGKKLKNGEDLSTILKVNAIPGFSEHHTGHAIDLSTTECPPLSEEFELTPAFEWLQKNAKTYQFSMSFPRSNNRGVSYEPWHWFCQLSS